MMSNANAYDYHIVKCNENNGICIIYNKYLKYGLQTKEGKNILDCKYASIKEAGSEGLFYIITDAESLSDGLAYKDGSIIINPQYHIKKSRINGFLQYSKPWNSNFGLIDIKTGKVFLGNKYTQIIKDAVGNFEVEIDSDKCGVANKNGQTIIPAEYYFIMLMNGNKYYRLHKEDGSKKDSFGIADINGKIIIPAECSWIEKNPSGYEYEVIRNNKIYVFNSLSGQLKESSKK